MLINCPECGEDGCSLFCKEGALAFFHGNVMIEEAKCVLCGEWKGVGTIPVCIAGCKHGGAQKIIEDESVDCKRGRAVETLAFYK